MRKRKSLSVALTTALLIAATSSPPAQAQLLSGAVGAVAGTGAGGYITLSIVVARAQFGHYFHDYYDLFHWQSLPIVIGAGTGTVIGILQPDRLWSALLYGSGATAAGVGIGYVVGDLISERAEGKWAGAAIGGGVGMTFGTIVGLLQPRETIVPEDIGSAAVPIGFRIRFE